MFWVGFVALDANALTSVVLAAVGTELLLVDKLLALWTRMVLVKTAASSEFSKVLARSSTVGTAATWLANVVVFVPLVSDWVFNIVVGTSVDWWNALLAWTAASSAVFDNFDGTAFHADWVWNLHKSWTLFLTLAVEHLATSFLINIFAIVKHFIGLTDWSWVELFWEHHRAIVWVTLINANIMILTFPNHTAAGPVKNVVVFGREIASWTTWTPGSVVEAVSLLIVSHVNIVSTQPTKALVEIIGVVSISLSVSWTVTVASLAHVPIVIPSPVTAELKSVRAHIDFTKVWLNLFTATLLWLLATALINPIGPILEVTRVLLGTVHVVSPVVVVELEGLTLQLLPSLITRVIWALVANTLVRVTTVIKLLLELSLVAVLAVWVKFTTEVLIPVLPVAWSLVPTGLLDTSVLWTADVG